MRILHLSQMRHPLGEALIELHHTQLALIGAVRIRDRASPMPVGRKHASASAKAFNGLEDEISRKDSLGEEKIKSGRLLSHFKRSRGRDLHEMSRLEKDFFLQNS